MLLLTGPIVIFPAFKRVTSTPDLLEQEKESLEGSMSYGILDEKRSRYRDTRNAYDGCWEYSMIRYSKIMCENQAYKTFPSIG